MNRAEAKERRRQQVLAAVESCIREAGRVDFSMRELAAKAEVSFATPFNLFGKKEDILVALFNKRVVEQASRASARAESSTGLENLLKVAEESCDAYLADAELFRPLARSLRGQQAPQIDSVAQQAQDIWHAALEQCLQEKTIKYNAGLKALARQLHISFRMVFSMWAADELSDREFRKQVVFNSAAFVLPFLTTAGKQQLTSLLQQQMGSDT